MVQVCQLELDLWAVLQEASSDPLEAEFRPIWQALEQVLPNLGVVAQLQTAAVTIGQVADIFQVQAESIFEELDATATQDGPRMPADAFDRYVRQYMAIDFEAYIEEPEALPRMKRMERESEDEFYTIVEAVEKMELLEVLHEEIALTEAQAHAEALSVAHGEDVTAWMEAIRAQVGEEAIELGVLRSRLGLAFVELWLGLLLGGYGLSRVAEMREEGFYSTIGILIELP